MVDVMAGVNTLIVRQVTQNRKMRKILEPCTDADCDTYFDVRESKTSSCARDTDTSLPPQSYRVI